MTQIEKTQLWYPADGSDPYEAITLYQEVYPTVSSWSSIVSFVFCSNTLPIEPNQVNTPVSFNENQFLTSGLNAASATVITDLTVE